ncbi:MAG: hypothetical protein JXR58_09915 [Bacteroidales bacterium]|nr:hypothetical protein [Bacteroidales bacterium]
MKLSIYTLLLLFIISGCDSSKQKRDVYRVDVLAIYRKLLTYDMYIAVTHKEYGLLRLVLADDIIGEGLSTINKLKQASEGANVTFTDREKAMLRMIGDTIGYNIKPENFENDSGGGIEQKALEAIMIGTYKYAKEQLPMYAESGNVPDNIAETIDAFWDVASSMEMIVENRGIAERNLRNISELILDPSSNVKPEFAGAKIEGWMPDGTPIINPKNLQFDKKDELEKEVSIKPIAYSEDDIEYKHGYLWWQPSFPASADKSISKPIGKNVSVKYDGHFKTYSVFYEDKKGEIKDIIFEYCDNGFHKHQDIYYLIWDNTKINHIDYINIVAISDENFWTNSYTITSLKSTAD